MQDGCENHKKRENDDGKLQAEQGRQDEEVRKHNGWLVTLNHWPAAVMWGVPRSHPMSSERLARGREG